MDKEETEDYRIKQLLDKLADFTDETDYLFVEYDALQLIHKVTKKYIFIFYDKNSKTYYTSKEPVRIYSKVIEHEHE